jgi:hypothetical protein
MAVTRTDKDATVPTFVNTIPPLTTTNALIHQCSTCKNLLDANNVCQSCSDAINLQWLQMKQMYMAQQTVPVMHQGMHLAAHHVNPSPVHTRSFHQHHHTKSSQPPLRHPRPWSVSPLQHTSASVYVPSSPGHSPHGYFGPNGFNAAGSPFSFPLHAHGGDGKSNDRKKCQTVECTSTIRAGSDYEFCKDCYLHKYKMRQCTFKPGCPNYTHSTCVACVSCYVSDIA